MYPEENLFRALAQCLACITSDSSISEELARVAPALTDEMREPFVMALHSLGKAADRNPSDVAEVFALANEIFHILEEKEVVADDDLAECVEAIKDLMVTIALAAGQLIRNGETSP